MNILIVDDDALSIKILSLILEKTEYKFTCCSNGLEAMEAIKNDNFDVVISDILMPHMDGLELFRKIREVMEDKIYIIGISAGAQCFPVEMSLSSASLYANSVLEKPIIKDELLFLLHEVNEVSKDRQNQNRL